MVISFFVRVINQLVPSLRLPFFWKALLKRNQPKTADGRPPPGRRGLTGTSVAASQIAGLSH
jgi:hypothetical protein